MSCRDMKERFGKNLMSRWSISSHWMRTHRTPVSASFSIRIGTPCDRDSHQWAVGDRVNRIRKKEEGRRKEEGGRRRKKEGRDGCSDH